MRASLLICLLFSAFQAAQAGEQPLCGRFLFAGKHTPDLSDVDKTFVCGDGESGAWKDVPENQAEFHLKTILKNQGFFHPKLDRKDGIIHVDIGEPTIVKNFRIQGSEFPHIEKRLRNIVGEKLVPALLDSIEQRLRFHIEMEGYPCPDVTTRGNPESAEVVAIVKPGPQQLIASVDREKVEGIHQDVFDRYQAFSVGELYNKMSIAITSQRLLDQNIVQSSYFATRCSEQGAALKQSLFAGPPRLVTIGVGVDTERWLILRARWQNSRLGEKASQLSLGALLSFAEQEASADMNWFAFTPGSRASIRSLFFIKRENFLPYDRVTTKLRVGPGYSWDTTNTSGEFSLGPTANAIELIRGEGRTTSVYASLGGSGKIESHEHEFYRNRPTTGFMTSLDFDLVQEGLLSLGTAYRLQWLGENHWNLFHYDPAFLILSIRAGASVTATPMDLHDPRLLSDHRHFMGGSTDVRSFSLREIPDSSGALTTAFMGFEARFADILPWQLQPFLFVDGGMAGKRSFQLDPAIYWGPGLGMRWQSPFGVFRVTLARGFVSDKTPTTVAPHWQPYFSYGEEF